MQSQIYFLSRINAPAKRLGHTLTNQRQSALIPSISQELFILTVFGSRYGQREHPTSSKERPLSRPLLRIFQHGRSSLEKRGYFQLHKRTNPAACHTSYLLLWHTSYKLKNQRSTCDTKKRIFSLWFKFTSAIRINLSLLCFKEVLLLIFYYKLMLWNIRW